jgi:hypothetical protein
MEYVLLAALFWSIAANGPKLLNFDGDLPRHLLVGRLIRETRSVPLTDTFSFRTAGFPAIPHEWLSQALFSLANDLLGLSGVVLFTALIVTITWAIVFGEASRRTNHLFITLMVTAIGIGSSMLHVLPRPHIFTYLFTALWIVVLEQLHQDKPQLWWLLPVVMLFWVNLHGMFVLGVILWGIYLLGNLLENPSRNWLTQPITRSMLLGGILSLLATFISPSGTYIWESIISLGSNSYITSRIPEYQTANFHMPETWPFILLLLLTMLGFARNGNKTTWTYILLSTSFAALAIYSGRMIPIFALITVPIVSKLLGDWENMDFPNSRFLAVEKNFSNMNSSSNGLVWLIVIFLIVVLQLKSGKTIDPQGRGNHFDSAFFPVKAVTWLNSHPQKGHMFNEFDWGGYLLLHLVPSQQIFMDGHTHIYGEALTREYETVITMGKDWQQIFDRYQVQWAIVRVNSPIAQELENNGWKILYQDNTAIILHRS